MNKPNEEIPKDLGIKMGTEEEAFWTTVKDQCKKNIKESKHEIIIQEEILKLAKHKILLEERK